MNKFTLTEKQMKALNIFEQVINHKMTKKAGALALNLSINGFYKKLNKYIKSGQASLIHGNKGKKSKRKTSNETCEKILELNAGLLSDAGPTFLAEKMQEQYNINISYETVRHILINNGRWEVKHSKPKHRKRRDRKPNFGEMVQLDGSLHDWFEGRREKCTLLVFIDDATSTVYAEFAESESFTAIATATKRYFEKYGMPFSFYTDHGSVFSINRDSKDKPKVTQYKRALNECGVDLILAGSPQAKGRVERSNKTHQDRLVKELRLQNISTIEAANEFLQNTYLPKHNAKFAVEAQSSNDVHRPIDGRDLSKTFCLKNKRCLANDYTISYKSRTFQILEPEKHEPICLRPKGKIIVRELLDEKIHLATDNNQPLQFTEIVKTVHNPPEPVPSCGHKCCFFSPPTLVYIHPFFYVKKALFRCVNK